MDLIIWSLPNPILILSFSRDAHGRHLGDGDGVVRALLVPHAANQLPVGGVGADVGAADDVLDGGLEVLVGAPAGGVCFQLHILANCPVQSLKTRRLHQWECLAFVCTHGLLVEYQRTCLGGALGGLEGGSELALGALREQGERVVLGDGTDDGDGDGEEGLELHFGGWEVWCLIGLVVVVFFSRLFE